MSDTRRTMRRSWTYHPLVLGALEQSTADSPRSGTQLDSTGAKCLRSRFAALRINGLHCPGCGPNAERIGLLHVRCRKRISTSSAAAAGSCLTSSAPHVTGVGTR